MNTQTLHDGTIESIYNKDDLERTTPEPTSETTENPVYSAAILKMVKKMRKGSIADNNTRSKKIAKALLKERRKMARAAKKAAKVVKPPAKPVQRTIMDF